METPDDNAPIPATQSLSAITQTRSLPARGEVGFMIGSYKVEKELGRGGMGVVYETVDENLHRRTALKVISPMLGINPEAIERLRNEARAVAKLNHPNIVSVYAFDYSEGLPFIAMEYVEGADLRQQCLRHGPMSAEVSLKYIRGAVAALGYAAKHRIIHRDIKPANIFLTNEGEIKVMDFGLAKELDVKSDLTGTGNTVGTPNYMSPEQVLAKPLDHRSDMYSLGCTLYTLLTGRLPFEAPSATEVMMSHVNS